MAHPRGWTLIELMVSLSLMTVLLGAVWGALATGQRAFDTSEAHLQAHESGRMALDSIAQDLRYARIISYYDGQQTTNGVAFIKFRRLAAPMSPMVTSGNFTILNWADEPTTMTAWSGGPTYMYIWCPQGSAGPPMPLYGNICGPGSIDRPPAPNQLLLVKGGPHHPTYDAFWTRERVVTSALQNPLTNPGVDARGVQFRVYKGAGTASPVQHAIHASCSSDISSGPAVLDADLCSNARGKPFGLLYDDNAPLRLRVEITVRTRGQTSWGRVIRTRSPAPGVWSGWRSVETVNRQDLPLP